MFVCVFIWFVIDFVLLLCCLGCGMIVECDYCFCMLCWILFDLFGGFGCVLCNCLLMGLDGIICVLCFEILLCYDGVWVVVVYGEVVCMFVLWLKYGWWMGLVKMMVFVFVLYIDSFGVVVLVFLYCWWLWSWGFNQVMLMVQGIVVQIGLLFDVNVLICKCVIVFLCGLLCKQCVDVVCGVFCIIWCFDGEIVWLVDDVYISGVIVNVCVVVLKCVGVGWVVVFVWVCVLQED